VGANLTVRGCAGAGWVNLMVGRICAVGELALGKLDWVNLHWVKDHRPSFSTSLAITQKWE